MGDMGEIFREWSVAKKEAKHLRAEVFDSEFKEIFEQITGFQQHSPYHYHFEIEGKRVDYWPTTGKWMFDKKVFMGTPKDLLGFIRNRKKAIKAFNQRYPLIVKAPEDEITDVTPPWED